MPPQRQSDRSAIPPAASDWKKGTLDLVNAKFDSRSVTDFIFDRLMLPNELQMGIPRRFIRTANVVINRVAEELSKVNNSDLITSDFDIKVSDHPSLWTFAKFYDDFTQLVRKKPLQSTTPATSQLASPPVQTTVPQNPQYSSPSTASTSSRESKAEPHTQIAANDFLWATLKAIEDRLRELSWYPGFLSTPNCVYCLWRRADL